MAAATTSYGGAGTGPDAWGRQPGDPMYGISPGSPTAGGGGATWASGGDVPLDPATGAPTGPSMSPLTTGSAGSAGGPGTILGGGGSGFLPPGTGLAPTYTPGSSSPYITVPTGTTTPPAAAASSSTAPASTGDPLRDWLLANAPSHIASDPGGLDYWYNAIKAHGGLTGDMGYWIMRLNQPDEGNSALGGGSASPSLPTPPPAASSDGGSAPSTAATIAAQIGASPTSGDQLMQLLMQRAQQSLDVNPNDPIIRRQTDAYSATQQQQERNALAALAEKAGPSGNIGAETRAANEQVAQNTSGFQAQLMQSELTARRNEIQNALTQWQGYLTDQQKMDLERQLAEMDNALQYARLAEQSSEFGQTLGQRAYEFDTAYQGGILGA